MQLQVCWRSTPRGKCLMQFFRLHDFAHGFWSCISNEVQDSNLVKHFEQTKKLWLLRCRLMAALVSVYLRHFKSPTVGSICTHTAWHE